MRPILLDTNAYAGFMRGEQEIVDVVAYAEKLHLNSVVLGELLGGFAAGGREAKNRAELARFLESPRVSVLPITANTVDSYALVYVGLRRKGQPIPANDLWIAASALEHGVALLSLDAHFGHVDGLRLGRRLEDFLP
ncbi:type II toxin-antitoxin system VapC family toxin [uncultured Pigmentiphaga sp.]|jgi:Predicted nucleic acid-binding protein, contains PIN domain|uniref:type II toxin-antitoxin system VapC family toxin n=1 Tax=uncultured Pigmentiphaga sp. TaxID=340361 RepID=UPI00260994A1|nr:type II toxin-antitoxin system VapC family toxin [uncultured Pigmentiphaga sp.]